MGQAISNAIISMYYLFYFMSFAFNLAHAPYNRNDNFGPAILFALASLSEFDTLLCVGAVLFVIYKTITKATKTLIEYNLFILFLYALFYTLFLVKHLTQKTYIESGNYVVYKSCSMIAISCIGILFSVFVRIKRSRSSNAIH